MEREHYNGHGFDCDSFKHRHIEFAIPSNIEFAIPANICNMPTCIEFAIPSNACKCDVCCIRGRIGDARRQVLKLGYVWGIMHRHSTLEDGAQTIVVECPQCSRSTLTSQYITNAIGIPPSGLARAASFGCHRAENYFMNQYNVE